MDDLDFKKIRNGLMTISIAIIIYVLGGGDVEKGSLIIGSIKFERPWIIEIFSVIFLIYMTLRYRLYSSELFNQWKVDYYYLFYTSDTYKKISRKYINEIDFLKNTKDNTIRKYVERMDRQNTFTICKRNDYTPTYNKFPLITYPYKKPEYLVYIHSENSCQDIPNIYQIMNPNADNFRAKLTKDDAKKLHRLRYKTYRNTITREKAATDLLLPIVLAISAYMCVIVVLFINFYKWSQNNNIFLIFKT